MSKSDVDVVRAWKDPAYRRTLTAEQLASLPEHPAGLVELSDDDLTGAIGGAMAGAVQTTAPTCTQYSFGGWKACGCGVATTAINCTNYTFQGWSSCGC
ncbi:MAG: mersacidin/lichenicidin family type 2 lantibiotic [Myxococcales bacterium]|nr:mersacidin/lichenicidin family type 2 lantibiotic [Myxococcales bacterium]MCB9712951.1 mersacidin/lichenicidin family type 2 lantibiotic [Myxococcales bacterium]